MMDNERFENQGRCTGNGPDGPENGFSVPGDFVTEGQDAGEPETGAYSGSSESDGYGGYSGYADAADAAAAGSYDSASSSTGFSSTEFSSSGSSTEGGSSSGRYYSYEKDRGRDTSAAGSASGRTGKRGEKQGKWIAVALAVILVFVLGAGAGTYISGRTATAELGAAAESSMARGETDQKAERAQTSEADPQTASEDSASAGPDTGSSAAQKTISQVDSNEISLSDTSVADVAEKVMPAIVSVYNKYTETGQFFGRTYTQEGESAGSGIIIEETDGELLIVTNNHVVEGADSLSVQFIDEENCEAALKGTDASSDLAVIAVSLDDIPQETKEQIAVAELGDSDSLRIGEHAIAIGNALGYGQSLTVGYISALNREITSEDGITGTFIQTDAAINPGNSGGALLNAQGQVIGINSNKIGGSAVEGMGFAIPISKAVPIINELKSQESRTKVAEDEQGMLGIQGITVTSDVASAYGLQVGAYVEEIVEGSGAAQSDLQTGDIITGINGQTVTGMEDLSSQLAYYAAGTEVTLTVQHPVDGGGYEEREIKVTLSDRSVFGDSSGSSGRQQQESQNWSYGEEEDEEYGNFFGFPFGSFGF